MKSNSLTDRVSNHDELNAAVERRARHIVVASDFKAWPDVADEFYSFLAANAQGIHVCERVFHPGSSLLDGYDDLCDLVLGGSEVTFELNPDCQMAVRFCEKFLSRLDHEVEARKASDSPAAQELVFNTDWSFRDKLGPCTLSVPTVIGFTEQINLNRYKVDKPAIIWSKHWQLAIDPIHKLISRVGQCIHSYNQSLGIPNENNQYKTDKPAIIWSKLWQLAIDPILKLISRVGQCNHSYNQSLGFSNDNKDKPPGLDSWIDIAIAQLRIWVEEGTSLPTTSFDKLSHEQLPVHYFKTRLAERQIKTICDELAQRILNRDMINDLAMMMRAPAVSMYEKADWSMGQNAKAHLDCWGYPFAFDLAFGSGVVKVRCAGMVELIEPAVEQPVATTQEGESGLAVDPPLSLNEKMMFKLANDCDELDRTTRRKPSHFAVLKAALIEKRGPYEMERIHKWKRKTAETRLKNIEVKLLNGRKINQLCVDPAIFRNVEAQLKEGRTHGVRIHAPTLLDNTKAQMTDTDGE